MEGPQVKGDNSRADKFLGKSSKCKRLINWSICKIRVKVYHHHKIKAHRHNRTSIKILLFIYEKISFCIDYALPYQNENHYKHCIDPYRAKVIIYQIDNLEQIFLPHSFYCVVNNQVSINS